MTNEEAIKEREEILKKVLTTKGIGVNWLLASDEWILKGRAYDIEFAKKFPQYQGRPPHLAQLQSGTWGSVCTRVVRDVYGMREKIKNNREYLFTQMTGQHFLFWEDVYDGKRYSATLYNNSMRDLPFEELEGVPIHYFNLTPTFLDKDPIEVFGFVCGGPEAKPSPAVLIKRFMGKVFMPVIEVPRSPCPGNACISNNYRNLKIQAFWVIHEIEFIDWHAGKKIKHRDSLKELGRWLQEAYARKYGMEHHVAPIDFKWKDIGEYYKGYSEESHNYGLDKPFVRKIIDELKEKMLNHWYVQGMNKFKEITMELPPEEIKKLKVYYDSYKQDVLDLFAGKRKNDPDERPEKLEILDKYCSVDILKKEKGKWVKR